MESRTTFPGLPRWAAFLREAILGSRQDFTEGSIGRAIFMLAVPMILEMAMESLFGIINVFWVSHLGAEARTATATVGVTESLLTLVFGVALGMSMAPTATVARRIGEKDPRGASKAAFQSILLGVTISVPIGVIGVAFAPRLLALMGASDHVVAAGTYARIILGGNVVIMLLFLINAVFRGAGDASIAMRALWLADPMKIMVYSCLIFWLGAVSKLGVSGSGGAAPNRTRNRRVVLLVGG